MPARRRVAVPAPLDIDRVRADLAAGKAVRVAIATSAHFPEGTSGRVRAVGDPDVVGPEFVDVEVTVNGVKDVVPFAPSDLAQPVTRRRGANSDASPDSAPTPGARSTGKAPNSGGTAVTAAPPGPLPATGAGAAPAPGTPAGPLPATGAGPSSTAGRATGPAPGPEGASGPRPAASTPPVSAGGPAAGRAAGGRRSARAITVTLTTTEAEPTVWRVEARIGAKVAVRSTPVPPARAWDLVQSLGNEALCTAVGAVLEQHRRATSARAEALAAELAALQAELQTLPSASAPAGRDHPGPDEPGR